MSREANILDPIHAELDARVWDNPVADKPVLKPVHAHWIKSHIYKTLENGGYTDVEKWLTLVLTGSLTTYQYSDDSDVDISLFVDTKIFPEWSRAEMIALMVEKLDGVLLPGTPHPLQDFVVGEGIKPSDLYKPGLRSGYNLDNNKWIVPPERGRAHDVQKEEGGFYAWALQMADKMERLLKYEPDQAIAFWHSIHKKRQRDMVKGKGDFSESNIIYKMLANRNLFPAISQASGEYIAKTAAKDWFAPSYMIPDDAKQQIHEWAQTLPWPEGSKFTPPDRYHVTGIYSPSGFSDPSHHEWIESHSGLSYPVQTAGVDNFTPSKVGVGAPVVLRVHHPQLEEDTERLIDEAQKRGLPVSRFPGGYKPHITVGHSLTPIQADHPGLSFPVGPLRDLHSYYDELKARTGGAPVKPPRLRQGSPTKNCLSCKMYHKNKGGRGKCWGYGEYGVRADQVCDSYEKETRGVLGGAETQHNLEYDRAQHPEGKGFILDNGSVWTWPTENLRPMHMQYSYKVKQQGQQVVPGSAFHIKDGQVWQYGPGRSLSPEQHQTIFAADPKLELTPPRQQEQLDTTPGFGHGQNVLDILQRGSSWTFRSTTSIHDIAWLIYENALQGTGGTFNLRGESPHTRYGFAPDLATQTPFSVETFSPDDVEAFIHRFSDRLQDPDKFVGSWIQGDQVILDVTEGHDDYQTAHQRAWDGHQKSLWDSKSNEEVPVRGLAYEQPVV